MRIRVRVRVLILTRTRTREPEPELTGVGAAVHGGRLELQLAVLADGAADEDLG